MKSTCCLSLGSKFKAFGQRFGPLQNRDYVAKVASGVEVREFQPKKVIINETTNQAQEVKGDDDEQVISDLVAKLLLRKPLGTNDVKLTLTEFEKDDDTNFHIDFIASVANLRARNYALEEAEKFKIKLIAGKIIPAIATTTAMVVGAVGVEIMKFILQKPIEKMKNLFANLAIPLWVFSEPQPPIKNTDKDYDMILLGPVKAVPPGFTTWDKLIVQGPMTFEDIMKYLKEKYALQVSIISCGKLCVYNKYGGGADQAKRLKMTPDACYQHITKEEYPKHKKFVELEVSGETVYGVDCITPSVKYIRP